MGWTLLVIVLTVAIVAFMFSDTGLSCLYGLGWGCVGLFLVCIALLAAIIVVAVIGAAFT